MLLCPGHEEDHRSLRIRAVSCNDLLEISTGALLIVSNRSLVKPVAPDFPSCRGLGLVWQSTRQALSLFSTRTQVEGHGAIDVLSI